jgi:hypothetical protein
LVNKNPEGLWNRNRDVFKFTGDHASEVSPKVERNMDVFNRLVRSVTAYKVCGTVTWDVFKWYNMLAVLVDVGGTGKWDVFKSVISSTVDSAKVWNVTWDVFKYVTYEGDKI